MTRIGKERGWQGLSRSQFDASTEKQGALLVGSPQEVIDKILYEHELFHHTRFLAQMSVGALPHKHAMKTIELLGDIVAPAVRKEMGDSVDSEMGDGRWEMVDCRLQVVVSGSKILVPRFSDSQIPRFPDSITGLLLERVQKTDLRRSN